MEAKVDELSLTIVDLRKDKEDQAAQLQFVMAESSDIPHEREAMFNNQRAQIRTLTGQNQQLQAKLNDTKRTTAYWKKQAEALGWQPEK